jgi:aminopeptidase C
VGWDKDDEGTGFWIVENTWGDSWGIKGLGHIAVGQKQLYLDEFVIAPHPKLEKEGSAEVADDEDLADDLVDEKAEPVDLDDKSS